MDAHLSSFPGFLLHGVDWCYRDLAPYATQTELEAAVTEYNSQTHPNRWNPDGEALRASRIRLKYKGIERPAARDYDDFTVEIASDDGVSFTQGELMFKLHNAAVGHLNDAGHCYFEGLTLRGEEDGVPLYEMQQGS